MKKLFKEVFVWIKSLLRLLIDEIKGLIIENTDIRK